MPPWSEPKRKVFISFFGDDEREALDYVEWAESAGVMMPRMLHTAYSGDFVDSSDVEYVMGVIRKDYLADSSVTMLLLGTCTHSRRYVDWELKSSLRQGSYVPNGLLAVSLPSAPSSLHLPPRFQDNWRQDGTGYANWYPHSRNAAEVARCVNGSLIPSRSDG